MDDDVLTNGRKSLRFETKFNCPLFKLQNKLNDNNSFLKTQTYKFYDVWETPSDGISERDQSIE